MIRKNTIFGFGFLIILIISIFCAITWACYENLEYWYDKDMTYIDDSEWGALSTTLLLKLEQANIYGQGLGERINYKLKNAYEDQYEQIAYDLDHYSEPDNPIRKAVAETIENFYFDNIISNNTDPFVVFGETISADNSDDCASFGNSRTFEDEYGMHANPELAKIAFYRIKIADVENYGKGAVHKPIFFQFIDHPYGVKIKKDYGLLYKEHENKKAWILDTYDIAGLKKSFYETRDWRKVFYAFEFITPTYLFYKTDLAGRFFVENGLRTDVDRFAINVTFIFKSVVDNMPELRSLLTQYEERRIEVKLWFDQTRILLLLLLFIELIIGIIAILYTERVTRINYGRNRNI